MKVRFSLVPLLLLAIVSPSLAGRNGGGAILVHTNDSYTFSVESACETPLSEPASCEQAVTRTDKASGSVVWLIAAFADGTDPWLACVYFGIDYDAAHLDPGVAFTRCGPPGTLDIPDSGWPITGRGNTVAFGTPIEGDRLVPFYVFVIDNPGAFEGAAFSSAVNPLGGYAGFWDGARPPLEDRCTRFGTVRWYAEGSNTCPGPDDPTVPGACCLPNTTCQVTAHIYACQDLGGTYLGDGTTCDSQCGACCYWQTTMDRRCVVTTQEDCENDARWDAIKIYIHTGMVGAEWSGGPNECTADPAQAEIKWYCQNPGEYSGTSAVSWGQIKALFR